jgi:hypothetical protein
MEDWLWKIIKILKILKIAKINNIKTNKKLITNKAIKINKIYQILINHIFNKHKAQIKMHLFVLDHKIITLIIP